MNLNLGATLLGVTTLSIAAFGTCAFASRNQKKIQVELLRKANYVSSLLFFASCAHLVYSWRTEHAFPITSLWSFGIHMTYLLAFFGVAHVIGLQEEDAGKKAAAECSPMMMAPEDEAYYGSLAYRTL